jgi:preprotein translocase subunit SecG
MTIIFIILIILTSVILGLIVLIQNPKGGGLAGNIAGFSNQFMGVKQTTDVLEKGTWIFAAIIGVLCLTASLFIRGGGGSEIPAITPNTQQVPAPATGTQNPPVNQPATNPVNPADTGNK